MGTLVLDFLDTGTRKLVWRGAAEAEINTQAPLPERNRLLNEAVSKMLKKFPPK